MTAYRSRSIILVLVFVIVFGIYFVSKQSTDEPTKVQSSDTISNSSTAETSAQQTMDPTDFLNQFAGEWKSMEDSETLIIREAGQSVELEYPETDYKFKVYLSDYHASYRRWRLLPANGEASQYHVTQLSDDEFSFQSSTTQANTEGTSKPETFFRVK